MKNYRSGFDNLWLGTIVGIILPFLSMMTFYYSSFTGVSMGYFFEHSLQIKVLPKIISICAIPNLAAFFLFLWRNHLYSARGVILATFIITFFVIALNVIF